MRVLTLCMLVMTACSGSDDTDDTDTSDDTDTDTDTDTDSDSDSDTDTDVGELVYPGFDLEVRVEDPESTWRIAAVRTSIDPDLDFGEEVVSIPATSTTLTLPDVMDSDVADVDGQRIDLYFLFVYDDENGDAVHSTDEAVVGSSLFAPVLFVDGDSQWVGLEVQLSGAEPAVFALSNGIDITPFPVTEGVELAGTIEMSVGTPAPDRLAGVSHLESGGALLDDRPFDDVVASPWSVSLTQPLDRWRTTPVDGGFLIGLEVPFGYTDLDGSESFSDGDNPSSWVCDGELPVFLLYVPHAGDWRGAFSMLSSDFPLGWTAITGAEPVVPVDPANLNTLVLSDVACEEPF